jgi:3-oxoacyl-[acyl-carrier protein] reductase
MAKTDSGFDKFDPKNIANLIGFLASPEAADVSGQVYVVFGGDVWVMGGFHVVGEVHRDGPWTPAELAAAKGEMYKNASSGVPPFSFF